MYVSRKSNHQLQSQPFNIYKTKLEKSKRRDGTNAFFSPRRTCANDKKIRVFRVCLASLEISRFLLVLTIHVSSFLFALSLSLFLLHVAVHATDFSAFKFSNAHESRALRNAITIKGHEPRGWVHLEPLRRPRKVPHLSGNVVSYFKVL